MNGIKKIASVLVQLMSGAPLYFVSFKEDPVRGHLTSNEAIFDAGFNSAIFANYRKRNLLSDSSTSTVEWIIDDKYYYVFTCRNGVIVEVTGLFSDAPYLKFKAQRILEDFTDYMVHKKFKFNRGELNVDN